MGICLDKGSRMHCFSKQRQEGAEGPVVLLVVGISQAGSSGGMRPAVVSHRLKHKKNNIERENINFMCSFSTENTSLYHADQTQITICCLL